MKLLKKIKSQVVCILKKNANNVGTLLETSRSIRPQSASEMTYIVSSGALNSTHSHSASNCYSVVKPRLFRHM